MKLSFCIVFFSIFTISYSHEQADSSKTKLKANGTISLNSNGIASIPAFSLDKPAIIASITLAKNRFSYDPQLAYGLDFKAWFIDSWFHYKIVDKPHFEFRTGVNFSTFFSDNKVQDEAIRQAQRYFAIELTGVYKLSPKSSLTFAYWNDRGQDKGTLKGHFFNLIGEKSEISIGKNVLLSAALQLFYIDYEGNNDGLFISPKISSSVRNAPVSIFFQPIQAFYSNISPFPGFRWNLGLSYTL
ncbi:MAG: hypothetical protein EPN88_11500 [Bacteroidetes bacterium]|nr:MAG: hypothetical protein EPN88_11500 [Bacteroidota bacterium]